VTAAFRVSARAPRWKTVAMSSRVMNFFCAGSGISSAASNGGITDGNGSYGGLNGVGGLDAITPGLTLFNPTITDFRGDVLGYYDSAAGSNTWISARPTGYGAVPGFQ
jgi:hypothetical protein